MTDLIQRIEEATGPSAELDAEIFRHIGAPLPTQFAGMAIDLKPTPDSASGYVVPIGEMQIRYEPPTYTASIDAAMTLVPEGWCVSIRQQDRGWSADLQKGFRTSYTEVIFCERSKHGWPATPALALCAAALRASQGEGE